MSAAPDTENRQTRRVPVDVRVYFGNRGADHLGFVEDVSETGLRVRARKAYPPGTSIQINVEIPGHGIVAARAKVVRARRIKPPMPPNEPVEMGLVIIEGNRILSEMVDRLLKQFAEQRAGRRIEARVRANLGRARRIIEEYTQNIGEGGVFVVTENPPSAHETVSVSLGLPDPFGTVDVECEVVHVVAADDAAAKGLLPGCGLRLTAFARDGQERYSRYLESLRQTR